MRRYMMRAIRRATLFSTLLVGIPVIGAIWWAGTTRPDLVVRWLDAPHGLMLAILLAILVVLCVVGTFASLWGAHRAVDRVVRSIDQLARQAERLGQGEARLTPMTSGITEVDQISGVICRSASHLAESLAAEREFASDASHQLRTPLTALLMRLEEVSTTEDIEVVREEAGVAIAQVERLTRVVDELLMRSRRGGQKIPIPTVSLDTVIASLQREWQPAYAKARRSIRVEGARGLTVLATPVALSQILSTLLENSLIHGRGTVQVTARRSGPSVVIEVTDEGEGVAAAIAPHIFERAVSTGSGASSGLGLALARDLAESIGGRLDLVQARPVRFALFLSKGR